jgi:hypothetical protein
LAIDSIIFERVLVVGKGWSDLEGRKALFIGERFVFIVPLTIDPFEIDKVRDFLAVTVNISDLPILPATRSKVRSVRWSGETAPRHSKNFMRI